MRLAYKLRVNAALCEIRETTIMIKFQQIIGAKLESVSETIATYVDAGEKNETLKVNVFSLNFNIGCFSIENPYTLYGVSSLIDLQGCKIQDAFSNSKEILIKFENNASISVSLKDEDFVGPEAASYSPNQGEIVVFN